MKRIDTDKLIPGIITDEYFNKYNTQFILQTVII